MYKGKVLRGCKQEKIADATQWISEQRDVHQITFFRYFNDFSEKGRFNIESSCHVYRVKRQFLVIKRNESPTLVNTLEEALKIALEFIRGSDIAKVYMGSRGKAGAEFNRVAIDVEEYRDSLDELR